MAMTTMQDVQSSYWSRADRLPRSSYFGITLQPFWSLLVGLALDASDSATEYFGKPRSGRMAHEQPVLQARGGYAKRVLDIGIGGVALIALLPLMAIVALIIKVTVGGKVFYAHPRVGLGGAIFPCLKFRTMASNSDEVLERHLASDRLAAAEWLETQKLTNDPRVTAIGRLLRKASLDELPQLINVLRGEMSIVGPRPVVVAELKRYGDYAADYLSARPGLTGLWQVSGRSRRSYKDRVALDRYYVRQWSLKLDFELLFMTLPAVLNFDAAA